MKVTATVAAGNKTHRVVISKDGKNVFITNTGSNTVTVLDTGSS